MSGESRISWTDAVWNPVTGCTRVSAGCDNCYAFALHDHRFAANRKAATEALLAEPGPVSWETRRAPEQARERGAKLPCPAQYDLPFSQVQLFESRLTAPLGWRAPRRVFVNSMSDLFHESVPDGFIVRVLFTMLQTPEHTYQILTKRPERMREFFTRWADLAGESSEPKLVRGPAATREAHPSGRGQLFAAYLESLAASTGGEPPPGAAWPTFDWMEGPRWWSTRPAQNVWLGTSVEDQAAADERIPRLLETPAAVRFISAEPLLGPLDLPPYIPFVPGQGFRAARGALAPGFADRPRLDWVIVGAESGAHRRPFEVEWALSLQRQCAAAGVAFFAKQGPGFRSEAPFGVEALDSPAARAFPRGSAEFSVLSAEGVGP